MEKESKKKPIADQSQDEQTVSFDSWFTAKVHQKRKVQAHHYGAIRAYFDNQGLSDQETAEDFESALKIYGY